MTEASELTNLRDRTPLEVDTRLAELDGQVRPLRRTIASNLDYLHSAAGDRGYYVTRTRKAWTMTDAEAERIARQQVTDGTVSLSYRTGAASAIEDLDAARAKLDVLDAEIVTLDAEFERRGWSRFFVVQNNGGHIHSSKGCKTCNKRGLATDFGWLPEWSGRSEEEALAALRTAEQAVMCTVCFPNAPVEWHSASAKPVDERYCAGQGEWALDPQMRYASPRGTCPECKQTGVSVSRLGKMLRHRKPEAK